MRQLSSAQRSLLSQKPRRKKTARFFRGLPAIIVLAVFGTLFQGANGQASEGTALTAEQCAKFNRKKKKCRQQGCQYKKRKCTALETSKPLTHAECAEFHEQRDYCLASGCEYKKGRCIMMHPSMVIELPPQQARKKTSFQCTSLKNKKKCGKLKKTKRDGRKRNLCKWDRNTNTCQASCKFWLPWFFEGDPRIPYGQDNASEIHDFYYNHQEACGVIAFSGKGYPPEHLTGTPPTEASFDKLITSEEERLQKAAEYMETPFTVDVDKLTEKEFNSLCLTTADCREPPMISVIRNVDGTLWKPNFKTVAAKRFDDKDVYCCDQNTTGRSENGAMDTNFFTLHHLPPAARRRVRFSVKQPSVTYYPKGATDMSEATIAKIEFIYKQERLYTYVDLTCGGRDYYRRIGFLGSWKSKLGSGIYYEIKYEGRKGFPSTHGPMRADMGFSTKILDGQGRMSDLSFEVMGVTNEEDQGTVTDDTTFRWVALRQVWQTASKLSDEKLLAAYLKTGFEWTLFSPPKGNWPVALSYFLAAQRLCKTMGANNKCTPDWGSVKTYSGPYYLQEKPALDYLAEKDGEGIPRFMSRDLGISADGTITTGTCADKLPRAFGATFPNGGQAPEVQCKEMTKEGGVLVCSKWCNSSCKDFWSEVIEPARERVWDDLQNQMPTCFDCPGLIGNLREDVPSNFGSSFEKLAFHPQCGPILKNWGSYELWHSPEYINDQAIPSSSAWVIDPNTHFDDVTNTCSFDKEN